MGKCKICGCKDAHVAYEGPIRMGTFKKISNEVYKLYQCDSCGVIALPPITENTRVYYESQTYRQEVDEITTVSDYFRLHGAEQIRHLKITGTSLFKDKTVCDVGCGAGCFLDVIRDLSQTAIAIEPSEEFRRSLAERGYVTFPYLKDALHDYENKVDVAVTFSVLEHIEDPLLFLKEISRLLSPQGRLILSTPNACDILLEALPELYPSFFYRKAHLWYFSSQSLLNILRHAGFTKIRIIPHQRFGLSNFLAWLKDRSPRGEVKSDYITPAMDAVWKTELERTLRCDYLYAEAVCEEEFNT